MSAFRNTYTAVVFDLDGTLIDSAPEIAAVLNATLATEQLAPYGLDDVKRMIGGGAETLIERALSKRGDENSPARVRRLLEEFLGRYASGSHQHHSQLYPGALETLSALVAAGVRLGLCTNKPHDIALSVLDAFKMSPMFASVVGMTPALPPKPAPDMAVKVLLELGTSPQSAVFVGDSAADLGAARAAGLRCILMSHGYSTVAVEDLRADAVVASFKGLSDLLAV